MATTIYRHFKNDEFPIEGCGKIQQVSSMNWKYHMQNTKTTLTMAGNELLGRFSLQKLSTVKIKDGMRAWDLGSSEL